MPQDGERAVGRTDENVAQSDALDRAIEAWRGDMDDGRALAGVRAGFLARQADALQSRAEALAELARATANLLDRIGEGTVEPTAAIADALADAAARLRDPADDVEANAVGDAAERLDAFASGLPELGLDDAASGESPRDVLPLLTVRHDGVRVRPGSFEVESDVGPASELTVLADACGAIAEYLGGQLEAMRATADAGPEPDLRRITVALECAVDSIARVGRTLARYEGQAD